MKLEKVYLVRISNFLKIKHKIDFTIKLFNYENTRKKKEAGQTHYKQISEFLAPSHGCVIQNRAIMRYTLFVV